MKALRCVDCERKLQPRRRTLRPNLETRQGRYAAIVAAHPEWATEPVGWFVSYKLVPRKERR